jgi:hypothetical protein
MKTLNYRTRGTVESDYTYCIYAKVCIYKTQLLPYSDYNDLYMIST